MIQKISSSDNKYNLKQNIILASAGGIALGAKEAYDTRQELSNKKQFFKKFMKTVFYDNDYLEKEKNYFNQQLEKSKNLGEYFNNLEQQSIDNFYNNVKTLIKDTKQEFKQEISTITKQAPLKITLKTLGGATIGLGISLLINYIKDKTKKK